MCKIFWDIFLGGSCSACSALSARSACSPAGWHREVCSGPHSSNRSVPLKGNFRLMLVRITGPNQFWIDPANAIGGDLRQSAVKLFYFPGRNLDRRSNGFSQMELNSLPWQQLPKRGPLPVPREPVGQEDGPYQNGLN